MQKKIPQSYQTRISAKIVQKKPKKLLKKRKGYFLSFSLFFMLTIVPKGKMGPRKGGKQG